MQKETTNATKTGAARTVIVTASRKKILQVVNVHTADGKDHQVCQRPFRVGLIYDRNESKDSAQCARLQGAITYAVRQMAGEGTIVEFINAKMDPEPFEKVRINYSHNNYSEQNWKRAERELESVMDRFIRKHVDVSVFVSEYLIALQPTIDMLAVFPWSTPDIVSEIGSFASGIYTEITKTTRPNAVTNRKGADPCVAVGLIGDERNVALLCGRQLELPGRAETHKSFSNVLIRWCILPPGIREDLMNRLHRNNPEKTKKAHRRWFTDMLRHLPVTYTKRNYVGKRVSAPKLCAYILADVRTEQLLLGLTEKEYCELSSQPGAVTKRLNNIVKSDPKWPIREMDGGKIPLVSAIDIYSQAIAKVVCCK